MLEELISFKTAKLAKKKGFNESGRLWLFYNRNGERWNSEYESDEELCICCTQFLLQKWLREEHHLNIVVSPSHFMYDPCKVLYRSQVFAGLNEPIFDDFETYEEALEKGIYEALKMI